MKKILLIILLCFVLFVIAFYTYLEIQTYIEEKNFQEYAEQYKRTTGMEIYRKPTSLSGRTFLRFCSIMFFTPVYLFSSIFLLKKYKDKKDKTVLLLVIFSFSIYLITLTCCSILHISSAIIYFIYISIKLVPSIYACTLISEK